MPLQIGYLMDKLYNMDKTLGGTAASSKTSGDEFNNIKDIIVQKFHALRKKMEDKDKRGRTADTVRLEIEIKDILGEIEQLLSKMNETLRKQAKDKKKFTEASTQQKQKIYDNLRQQVSDVQTILDPNSSNNSSNDSRFDKVETVTDMKSRLMLEGKGGSSASRSSAPKDASNEEKAAMERWKANDTQMDGQLDQIIAGTAQWKDKAQIIGGKIDQTTVQIARLEVEVDKTNTELEKQNKALKDIVEKYRQPNKFCLDIVLICILLGLAGAIYTVMKK